jgi:AcrR family transcriptional regulator
LDALTADRRAHAGPSQVDTSPIPLPHGFLAAFGLPYPDDGRLGLNVRHTDTAASGPDYLFILDQPAAAAFIDRLLAYVSPAQPGGMAAPTAHPWFDLLQEQRRQIHLEGFAPAHDDWHTLGELAAAAACYALAGMLSPAERAERRIAEQPPKQWPFEAEWWKPTTPRNDLVQAGAFILAEISRLDRLAQRSAAE